MPLARLLPERVRRLAREVTTYGIVAIINTAIDFALFNELIGLGALKANTVSTIVATTTSFLMNRHWVYRDRPRKAMHREYMLFFGVNLVGLVIQEVVLGLAALGVHHMSDNRLEVNLYKCLGVAVAMVFRFWAYRTLVFKPHQTGDLPEEAADATAVAGPREPSGDLVEIRTAALEVTPPRAERGPAPDLDGGPWRGGAALS